MAWQRWDSPADGRAAARGFNRLIDANPEAPPANALGDYRAAFNASAEVAQFEFLIVVAGHLAMRLADTYPDSVDRAAHLLIVWFLVPTPSR